jgi:hypothetical protein
MIYVADNVKTITLNSALPQITKNLVIEGNGVVITRTGTWDSDDGGFLNITANTAVSISRVHFKNGRARYYGGAIYNQASAGGGAIYSSYAVTKVTGCTFYQNANTSSSSMGGAICLYNSTGTLTMTGNLFYGNTAAFSPTVYGAGSSSSGGYNVVDRAPGGWFMTATDKSVVGNSLLVSRTSFKLLQNSPAANVITALPEGYPALDFYSNPINAGAAAGAVQESVGDGYYIEWSINNPLAGTVTESSSPDADGVYSAALTLMASPTSSYSFEYWLVDGVKNAGNSLTISSNNAKIIAVFARVITVTSNADTDTSGTLRNVLNNAADGDIIRFASSVTEITVDSSALPQITGNKSITIEGNGVAIINRGLAIIAGSTLNISRVHFKKFQISNSGTLTVESCIFSGGANSYGGALNNGGFSLMTVKGCTFYGNTTTTNGGAIYNGGTLTLTGNLFYGNTAIGQGPVVFCYTPEGGGTVISGGYNVSDETLVTNARSDYTPRTEDVVIGTDLAKLPISGKTFKLIQGANGDALKIIDTLPEGYPAVDFYGNPISAGSAAGAVQASVTGSGYYVDLSFNNSSAGTVTPSVSADDDGLYTAGTMLSAAANTDYTFGYWLVNGVQNNANPLTINGNVKVVAVFSKVVTVTSNADTNISGTLRNVLNNAADGDKIIITAGLGTIELTSALPRITGTKSIIIEGNGVTLTRASSWTAINDNTQLLVIGSPAVAHVSRIHFKGGRATYMGGAIKNQGDLTVESCIFSDNTTSSNYPWGGGAIYNDAPTNTLTVKGCTFYNNKSDSSYGGAIYTSGPLTLTGNLFYGNTASSAANGHVVYRASSGNSTVTSGGYNVIDVALGIGGASSTGSGFVAATGDTTIANLLGDNTTTPFITSPPVNAADFAPVAGLQNVMPATAIADFPLTDFNGVTRDWQGAPGAVK